MVATAGSCIMKTRRERDLYPLDFNQLAWDANDPAGAIEKLVAGLVAKPSRLLIGT